MSSQMFREDEEIGETLLFIEALDKEIEGLVPKIRAELEKSDQLMARLEKGEEEAESDIGVLETRIRQLNEELRKLRQKQEEMAKSVDKVRRYKILLEHKLQAVEQVGKTSLSTVEVRPQVLKKSIDEIGFPVRVLGALRRNDIKTLGDLADKSENEILKLEHMGERDLAAIRQTLQPYGIILKQDTKED